MRLCERKHKKISKAGERELTIGRHLEDKDGNPTECYAANEEYRRGKAGCDRMDKMGEVRR